MPGVMQQHATHTHNIRQGHTKLQTTHKQQVKSAGVSIPQRITCRLSGTELKMLCQLSNLCSKYATCTCFVKGIIHVLYRAATVAGSTLKVMDCDPSCSDKS